MFDIYWEAWLNYEHRTNHKDTIEKRLENLFKIYSCTWIKYKDNKQIPTDYYPYILKKKYHNLYNNWKKQNGSK